MSNWSIYLLSNGTRTYIGSTTDVQRRLRQHNQEIRGGAKSTAGKKWKMVMWISGFENRSNACRWERIVKCRARGLIQRRTALEQLIFGNCPQKKGLIEYEVPEGLSLNLIGEYML